MSEIAIDLDNEQTLRLWAAVGDLVERLPGQWVLIGGLMVQLHALEHGVTDVRPTGDIDILGQGAPAGRVGLHRRDPSQGGLRAGRAGWELLRQRGSHEIWGRPGETTAPHRGGRKGQPHGPGGHAL